MRRTVAYRLLPALALALSALSSPDLRATDKLVDKVLFPHDEKVVFRWSEGSILNLDGKKHLLMAVTGPTLSCRAELRLDRRPPLLKRAIHSPPWRR